MIQRRQTLFILLAVVFTVACLCRPIAAVEPQGMGLQTVIWNFGIVTSHGPAFFGSWPLFVLLTVTVPMQLCAVFLYRKRMLQAKLCTLSAVLCFVWCTCYAFEAFNTFGLQGTFHPRFAACLPLVAAISLLLARQGIIHDEKLVRAADRIR